MVAVVSEDGVVTGFAADGHGRFCAGSSVSTGQRYLSWVSTTIQVEEPSQLVVDAGGPYEGVVGEPIALHGTVTGAQGEIRVT